MFKCLKAVFLTMLVITAYLSIPILVPLLVGGFIFTIIYCMIADGSDK